MSAPATAPVATSSHSHATSTRPAPRPPFWAFWVTIALLFLFGGLIWAFVRFSPFKDVDQRRADDRYKILGDVNTASEKALHDPASWVNKEKGTVRLPLDLAMRLELETLKNSKPEPGYPLSQSPPAPNPPPATGPAGGNAPAAGNNPPPTANANNPALPNQTTAAPPAPSPAVSPVPAGATPLPPVATPTPAAMPTATPEVPAPVEQAPPGQTPSR